MSNILNNLNKLTLEQYDPEIFKVIKAEKQRQNDYLELIASENHVSTAVLEATGSVLTNKYAEGYSGKRYYGGCEIVDQAEDLAIARVKKLFNCSYANVQPHSGSQANGAAYQALIKPGDKILGMDLAAGGHLTHGSSVSFSGQIYQAFTYGLNLQTYLIDYNEILEKALLYKPKLIIAGCSAYSRFIDWAKFREIADKVNAYLFVDMAHIAGLVAANLHPSPLPYADVVTSTTHKTLRGPRGGLILARDNPEIIKKLQSAVFPGLQGGPLMHVIAAKAVAFKEALEPNFITYQQQILDNAKIMAETLKNRNYPILTGGTDNHLFLLDLRTKNITGDRAQKLLQQAYITTNKNMLFQDPQPAQVTSGLRIGTPAVTTRGLKTPECEQVAHLIADLLDQPDDLTILNQVKNKVKILCQKFLVY